MKKYRNPSHAKAGEELNMTARVCIASAAGLAAAAVAALATTKTGRRVTRSATTFLAPLIVEQRGTLLAAVEESIGAVGVIKLIPEGLRHDLLQGLFGDASPVKASRSMPGRKLRAAGAARQNGRKKLHRRSDVRPVPSTPQIGDEMKGS